MGPAPLARTRNRHARVVSSNQGVKWVASSPAAADALQIKDVGGGGLDVGIAILGRLIEDVGRALVGRSNAQRSLAD